MSWNKPTKEKPTFTSLSFFTKIMVQVSACFLKGHGCLLHFFVLGHAVVLGTLGRLRSALTVSGTVEMFSLVSEVRVLAALDVLELREFFFFSTRRRWSVFVDKLTTRNSWFVSWFFVKIEFWFSKHPAPSKSNLNTPSPETQTNSRSGNWPIGKWWSSVCGFGWKNSRFSYQPQKNMAATTCLSKHYGQWLMRCTGLFCLKKSPFRQLIA